MGNKKASLRFTLCPRSALLSSGTERGMRTSASALPGLGLSSANRAGIKCVNQHRRLEFLKKLPFWGRVYITKRSVAWGLRVLMLEGFSSLIASQFGSLFQSIP